MLVRDRMWKIYNDSTQQQYLDENIDADIALYMIESSDDGNEDESMDEAKNDMIQMMKEPISETMQTTTKKASRLITIDEQQNRNACAHE